MIDRRDMITPRKLISIIASFSILNMTNAAIPFQQVADFLKSESAKNPARSWTVGIIYPAENEEQLSLEKYYSFGKASENSLFRIGGLTETFTAALLAEYIVEGKVRASDPAQEYLPDGVWLQTFNGDQITLGDLVTHTSGLPDIPWKGTNFSKFGKKEIFDFVNDVKLSKSPGDQYNYSRVGYALLTMCLEKIGGSPWQDLVRKVLLQPLGLNAISCFPIKRSLVLNGNNENGAINSLQWLPEHSNLLGVFGLYGSAADLLKWVHFQLGEGDTELNFLLPVQQDNCRKEHCFGWNSTIWSDDQDKKVFSCSSEFWGYSAAAVFLRESNIGVVVLADGMMNCNQIANKLTILLSPQSK